MTCSCPPRWCYGRSDCRKLSRVVGKRHPRMPAVGLQPIGALRLQWLEDRHDALTAELKDALPEHSRISKRHALAAIDAAIARYAQ
jgi:hypothetical protein